MHQPYLPDVDEKLRRIRAYLERNGYTGMILARHDNFSWLGGGANSRVVLSATEGFGVFVATPGGLFMVAQVMDGQRIMEEELAGVPAEYVPLRWYEESRSDKALALAGARPVSDIPLPGADCRLQDITDLHYPLTKTEVETMVWLGEKTDRILRAVADEIRPGMLDFEAAAMLQGAYTAENIHCDVLLVGTGERIPKYKHPSPVGSPLGPYVLLHPAVQHRGLHANVTRSVTFYDTVPPEIEKAYAAACAIQAACMAASVPGALWQDVLAMEKRLFAEWGYPEAWRDHYPGGRTGYCVCQADLSLRGESALQQGEAYDFFIAPPGAKVEELSLGQDAGGRVLSHTGHWPRRGEIDLPDILRR